MNGTKRKDVKKMFESKEDFEKFATDILEFENATIHFFSAEKDDSLLPEFEYVIERFEDVVRKFKYYKKKTGV